MSYQLRNEETIQKNIQRLAREQLDKAIDDIDDSGLDASQSIHQVRKRCKKLRALLRLVRPALGKTYQQENACFRDTARRLGVFRDKQSLVEVLERLQASLDNSERHRFDQVLGKLRARRDAAAGTAQQDPHALLAEARKSLQKAHQRVALWELDSEGFPAVKKGFKKTYRRGRKALESAFKTENASDFHEWRKRVKYHTHHLDLLKPLWPPILRAWRKETKTLADLLGDDHDLALLDRLLESKKEELAKESTRKDLQKLILCEQQRLRAQAWTIGQRLYAETPGALTRRWKSYWQTWT
ncbi:CHAD domain-containing protein [Marinospirillum sp.]|uniref:CHAD domain-containing protein n=1 Tax=Marinospirillum sp. TaxID=2183934 RepID=UPI00384FE0C0